MQAQFRKSQIRRDATVSIPSSKSLSHRALICASLAGGDSEIIHPAFNKDTEATMRVMECFGASFEEKDDRVIVHGINGKLRYDHQKADCGESGSTLRFLIPLAALLEEEVIFTGHGRLMERPQTVYDELFQKEGLLFEKKEDGLHVRGPLQAGNYQVRGDVSSQFISGLLFALPLCKGNSVLRIQPPFESASYVSLTLDALMKAGVSVQTGDLVYLIPGEQNYLPFHERIEGDDSQMAFFAELSLIQNRPLRVLNMNHASHQGDHVILEFVKKLGGHVTEIEDGYLFEGGNLHGCEMDLADCPDLGPALFALATQCEGDTVFHHCERLRIKESDRIAAMEEELRKLGCSIHSTEDTVIVHGKTAIRGNVTLNGHNDHRIVMALSMLATLTDGVVIEGAEAVNKSYPQFFQDLSETGIEVDYD